MRSEEEKPNYDTLISSIAEGIYNFRPAQNNSNIAISEAQKGYELNRAKATAHRIAQVVLDYYLQAGLVYNPDTHKVVPIDAEEWEDWEKTTYTDACILANELGYRLVRKDAVVVDKKEGLKNCIDYHGYCEGCPQAEMLGDNPDATDCRAGRPLNRLAKALEEE